MPAVMGIYEIRNLKDGKVYIGASRDIERRHKQHKAQLSKGVHSNRLLQEAWTRDGETSFGFTTLEVLSCASLIRRREKCLIQNFNLRDPDMGYNIVNGGQGTFTKQLPSPAKSRAITLLWSLPGEKAKRGSSISRALAGKPRGPHSPERYAKIAAANKSRAHLQRGVPLPAQQAAKIGQSNRGGKRSPETKAKMAEARRQSWKRPEYREKIVAAARNRHAQNTSVTCVDGKV